MQLICSTYCIAEHVWWTLWYDCLVKLFWFSLLKILRVTAAKMCCFQTLLSDPRYKNCQHQKTPSSQKHTFSVSLVFLVHGSLSPWGFSFPWDTRDHCVISLSNISAVCILITSWSLFSWCYMLGTPKYAAAKHSFISFLCVVIEYEDKCTMTAWWGKTTANTLHIRPSCWTKAFEENRRV